MVNGGDDRRPNLTETAPSSYKMGKNTPENNPNLLPSLRNDHKNDSFMCYETIWFLSTAMPVSDILIGFFYETSLMVNSLKRENI
ncbi:hypothetical protein DTO10_26370 [Peribacillus butanolivorans]|uniref:Uncharacterized protein n=1 Tax=Peribacillus butanolivorans TaxID=421767 RepID=A0ABM6XSR4_9BACI|nr:hypothetical protein DTO10_26370 [Peribacillus butanolivorans]